MTAVPDPVFDVVVVVVVLVFVVVLVATDPVGVPADV